jgi:hypothetical protein
MSNTIGCPRCERTLNVPDELMGTRVKCPACDETFTASEELLVRPPAARARSRADEDDDRRDEGRRRARDDYEDEPRPRRGRDSYRDEDDEEYRRPGRSRYDEDDDYDRRPRRRDDKPGKVQAIGIMTLVGGILALLHALTFFGLCFGFFWPGTYYSVVLGIMAIIKGAQLVGDRAWEGPPPTATGIMQIVNIINGDVINLTMGIIILVFLQDREVDRYFRR